MRQINIFSFLLMITFVLIHADMAFSQSTLDIDEKRTKDEKKLGVGIPNPEKLQIMAKKIFAKPIQKQSEKELTELAKESNRYANMVNFIKSRYDSYRRDSYRYDFVLKELNPPSRAYGKIFSKFLGYRNRAYFNLGLKAKQEGRSVAAMLFFRDALRLSSFDCGPGKLPQNCMRWKAEQEIQKLLGLEKIKAYVSWK